MNFQTKTQPRIIIVYTERPSGIYAAIGPTASRTVFFFQTIYVYRRTYKPVRTLRVFMLCCKFYFCHFFFVEILL